MMKSKKMITGNNIEIRKGKEKKSKEKKRRKKKSRKNTTIL